MNTPDQQSPEAINVSADPVIRSAQTVAYNAIADLTIRGLAEHHREAMATITNHLSSSLIDFDEDYGFESEPFTPRAATPIHAELDRIQTHLNAIRALVTHATATPVQAEAGA